MVEPSIGTKSGTINEMAKVEYTVHDADHQAEAVAIAVGQFKDDHPNKTVKTASQRLICESFEVTVEGSTE